VGESGLQIIVHLGRGSLGVDRRWALTTQIGVTEVQFGRPTVPGQWHQPIRRVRTRRVATVGIEAAKTAGRPEEQLVAATGPWPFVSPIASIV